ncbi:MAG: cobyrinate a,c-diamide synthase [Anaerolineales bacterium]|nr:cobyrinate a,c-diamide synthase [Anaerolineales bacterium]
MRIVIGGVQSGVGKTTVVAGLIAALHRRGLSVQPFKVGPDYIDPSYHTLAAGRPCRNLDTWMIPPQRLNALFHHHAQSADISIIEGVMGLFDGQNYLDDTGSTAQVAKLTGSPVILILDAAKAARSVAATALGFRHFDPDLPLAGFIVNYVAGGSHGQGVAEAIERTTGLPVLGWLPRNPDLEIPERHLGLVPTAEPGRWGDFIEAAAAHISRHIDLDRLLEIARQAQPSQTENLLAELRRKWVTGVPPGPVIAVARDEAFNFIYEENIDLLRVAGAEIAFFSPLEDDSLPAGARGVILSGGFPEMYAEKLSANEGIRRALQTAHAQGLPIYAECGGLMALTQAIIDLDGREYSMFGLLPGRSVMTKKLNMGYRVAQAADDSWLMQRGEQVRGHEFHYSIWEGRPDDLPPAYTLIPPDGQGEPRPEGACLGSLWASYVHLPFWNKPELALRFVTQCKERTPHAA